MRASVAYNRRISPAYLHLGMAAPGFPTTFRAGQFVMLRPPWVGDPFLPRAFSLYRIAAPPVMAGCPPGERAPLVEILYKVVGKGTQYLAQMEPGQEIDLLGPLGNAFTLPAVPGTAVLVAGGIGVPPISALALELGQSRGPRGTSREPRAASQAVQVFLGGKTSEDILCLKDFEEAGLSVQVTTEDGSLGTRGLVTDILEPFLITHHAVRLSAHDEASRITLFTCGPPGMLAAVARLAEARGIPCQTSVEANMACGFGACMGCAVEVQGDGQRYKLVCMDGPVFDSREIKW